MPDGIGDGTGDVADGLSDTLARIALRVAIPELDGFVNARGRARRYGRPTICTARERDFNFYRWIASRVEYFPSVNCLNPGIHSMTPGISGATMTRGKVPRSLHTWGGGAHNRCGVGQAISARQPDPEWVRELDADRGERERSIRKLRIDIIHDLRAQ